MTIRVNKYSTAYLTDSTNNADITGINRVNMGHLDLPVNQLMMDWSAYSPLLLYMHISAWDVLVLLWIIVEVN